MSSPFSHDSITLIPVLHGRLEYAAVVRAALLGMTARGEAPDAVAVELPAAWKDAVLSAVNRLPYLSLVLDESEERHLYLPVEPTDPIIEALRTAKDLGVPAECIDLDVDDYPLRREALPDAYAVRRLGYAAVMRAILAEGRFPRGPQDELRETMMAHALQALARPAPGEDRPRRVVCVLGAAHAAGVLERLRAPQPRPFARQPARALTLYNWSEKSSQEFMTEAPFLAAAYEHARRAADSPAPHAEHAPGGEAVQRGEAVLALDRELESERILREAVPGYAGEIGSEPGQAVSPHRFRLLGRFARKYARIEGMLVPDLFQLVVAARGCVDDAYARHVWEQGSLYPWQDGSGALPTMDLDESFAMVGARRITLRRTLKRARPRLRGIGDKRRAKEKYPGQWKSKWSGRVICSHVPEDLIIEDFGRYLKRRAKGMLSAERTRVEPFSVSMKDGLDVRETLRNWHARRLYVMENGRVTGNVGSVVAVLHNDGDTTVEPATEDKYPWLVTWLGEHEQESDMALYATRAGEAVIGPGISRCEYGGFVMSYPPRRMLDVWSDPYFDVARSKAERLLMAGLDYSEERYVVYAAERPPRPFFHTLAARMNKQIVYIPLGQLPRSTLNKIRTFHVLEGQSVREYADDYIR